MPRYDLISQAGIDVQATIGPWLLKLERTPRTAQSVDAATGGFEYALYNIFDTGTDLGIVAECMYDQRAWTHHNCLMMMWNHLRWTANDVQSTTLLLGIYDRRPTAPPYRWAERRFGLCSASLLRLQEKAAPATHSHKR